MHQSMQPKVGDLTDKIYWLNLLKGILQLT